MTTEQRAILDADRIQLDKALDEMTATNTPIKRQLAQLKKEWKAADRAYPDDLSPAQSQHLSEMKEKCEGLNTKFNENAKLYNAKVKEYNNKLKDFKRGGA